MKAVDPLDLPPVSPRLDRQFIADPDALYPQDTALKPCLSRCERLDTAASNGDCAPRACPRRSRPVNLRRRPVVGQLEDRASLDGTFLERYVFSMVTDRSSHRLSACAKERSTSRKIDQETTCDRT